MSDDPLRDEANRAAHRGMGVLCNMLETHDWSGNTIISKPDADELRRVAREYEELQRRQQAKPEATR